jgi:hypothetical protein
LAKASPRRRTVEELRLTPIDDVRTFAGRAATRKESDIETRTAAQWGAMRA